MGEISAKTGGICAHPAVFRRYMAWAASIFCWDVGPTRDSPSFAHNRARDSDITVNQPQASFSRVYASTRSQLRSAKLAPGTQILVNEWAALHGVSATPVREALAKLAGEALIEDRERLGYFVPLLSSIEVAGLYELLELYLVRAIAHWQRDLRGNPSGPRVDDSDEDDVATLMTIARRSNNPLLIEEVRRCLDRLAFARRRQADIFGPPEPMKNLIEVCTRGDAVKLTSTLRSYCRAGRNYADAVAHAMAAGYRATIARK